MSDQVAVYKDQALMPTTFDGLMEQAKVIFSSGLLPKSVRSPAAAVAIMLTGRELGITPMQSFRSIYVVDGTPTLSAQFIAAKLLEAGVTYRASEMTNERCTIDFSRGNGMTLTYTYTWDDATSAGLTSKSNWRQYRKDMLWSRCMTLGGRKIAPDALLGFHTADEIGAVVDPQSGQVIDTVAREIPGDEPITKEAEAAEPEKAIKEPPESPRTEPPTQTRERSAAEERTAIALARMFYARWDPLFPEDKDHEIAHREFQVLSIKDLYGKVTPQQMAPLLDTLDLAMQNTLTLQQLKELLGLVYLIDWFAAGYTREGGTEAITRYIDQQTGTSPLEGVGQQPLEMPSELAADGVPSEDIPIRGGADASTE